MHQYELTDPVLPFMVGHDMNGYLVGAAAWFSVCG